MNRGLAMPKTENLKEWLINERRTCGFQLALMNLTNSGHFPAATVDNLQTAHSWEVCDDSALR
jgi:hypothetical protein